MGRHFDDVGRVVGPGFHDRLRWLLEHRFGGNQRELSRRLGVSQSLVSRVARGERDAGPTFVAAVADLAGVNPDWVYTGDGDPLLRANPGALPVAGAVLPGMPADHPAMLTGETALVPVPMDRASRYVVRLAADHPLLGMPDLALLKGDLVLLDADPLAWTANLAGFVGNVVGVRVARRSSFAGQVVSCELGVLCLERRGLLVRLRQPAACPDEAGRPRGEPADEPEPAGREPVGEIVRLMEPEPDPAGVGGPAESHPRKLRSRPRRVRLRQADGAAAWADEYEGRVADLVALRVLTIRPA